MKAERRFNLIDGMIVVAATAVGLTMVRMHLAEHPFNLSMSPSRPGTWSVAVVIEQALEKALPLLFTTTFALLAIRLRKPRPRWLRLTRQPGFIACITATPTMAICALSSVPMIVFQWGRFQFDSSVADPFTLLARNFKFLDYTPEAGFVVTGAWLALALGRRWRSEPHWIDRTGRLLGVGWIGANLLHWLSLVLVSY